jgi:hypothetical protein
MLLKQEHMKSLNIGVFDTKLIHSASPYCGDNVFAKGLEQNGYNVTRLDYRAVDNPNVCLIDQADIIKPDLFWFGKCERISPDTIRVLKHRHKNAIFVKWGADVRDNPTEHDLGHNQYVDWFFATYGGNYLKKHLLHSMSGVASIMTFTDSDFYKCLGPNEEFASDILWTGRKGFGDNHMRNEIINNLLRRNNTKVLGLDKWYGYPEYLYYINNAKIGIGSNSFNRRLYSSDRLGNYMSCGTFYLTQYIEGMEKCFERGVHLDWFNSIEEMEEKIEYYLKNDKERKRIAYYGREHILEHFDCKPLVANLLNIIKTKKTNYIWDDVYLN